MSESRARRRGPGRRSAALAVAAAAGVLAAALPGALTATADAATLPHGLGALPPPATRVSAATGTRQLAAAARAAGGSLMAAASLPASVDLTAFAVPPGDQGQHGACVSWTTGYTLAGWEANVTHHVGAPFNPMYVYNQVNGGYDTRGTTFPANYSVLESQGVVESAYWTHAFSDYRSQPTTAERANAALHQMTAHTTLFVGAGQGATAQSAIETALANNQPVGIALPVYNNFFYLNSSNSTFGLADATGSIVGYHAVAVLGYSSAGVTIENSWGPNWGAHGFATLGWDFVESKVSEAYAEGSFVTGQNNLPPVVTGLSAVTTATGGGASLTVKAARIPSIDTTSGTAVEFQSLLNPAVQVPATVTATTDTTLTVRVPQLPADGQYRVVLTGSGGTSVPNGSLDVVTALSPYSIVLPVGQVGRSDASTWVTVIGSGFGTTLTQFSANRITATVNGKAASVARVDDTHLKVLVPPAPAGTSAPIVVLRNGVAGVPASINFLHPLPVVTALSPARTAAGGGGSITATVKNVSTTANATTVTLVSTADPSVTLTAPITAHTATGVTFTAPAAQGDYHVEITGDGGASLATTTDVLGFRTPITASTSATVVSAAGGTAVKLTGSGFGATSATFLANKITATVGGKAAALRWVNDGTLYVTAPAGTPGASAPIVLLHDTVPGTPITGLSYVALITGSSVPTGPTAGWTTTVSGVGLLHSGSWELQDSTGQTVASLPTVTTTADLTAATNGGVLLSSATTAVIHLPAESAGFYRLVFTPDPGTYPGASLAFTGKSVVIYSDLG